MEAKDPVNAPNPTDYTTCRATNRSGTRCGRRPVPGATVCKLHGGAAPQVRAKAQQRLLEAADPAAAYLASLVKDRKAPVSDRRQAAVAILDRAESGTEAKLKVNFDLSKLSEAELEQALELSRKATQGEG